MASPGDELGGGRGLRLRWVVANIGGFTIGGAIARAMGQPHYEVVASTADTVLIATRTAGLALALCGAAVGTAQWLVIRGELRRVGWWILATSAGWALAGVAGGILSGFIGGTVTGIGREVGVWGFVVAAAVGILALGSCRSCSNGWCCGVRSIALGDGSWSHRVIPRGGVRGCGRREMGSRERDRCAPPRGLPFGQGLGVVLSHEGRSARSVAGAVKTGVPR